MPDYSQGKIYKVTCGETGDIYIGSTTQSLKRRFKDHNLKTNNCETRHFTNPTIELIKNFPCESKEALLWEERKWYDEKDCVNAQRPIVSNAEKKSEKILYDLKYCKDNAEHKGIVSAKHYKDNKEHFNLYHKQRYENNKETILAKNKKYRDENKERISAKRKERILCDCGDFVQRARKTKHCLTQKHLNKIANLE